MSFFAEFGIVTISIVLALAPQILEVYLEGKQMNC